ncbi:MAG: ARS binding protein 2-domain-containing protein [Benjaminiella poitrasii]|nr:MAG: ARS binding protein 2-domain-containing protein [Benjaminiella poitrasii]
MNLSDLVHRTAGDNKALSTTNANPASHTSTTVAASANSHHSNNNDTNSILQQSLIDPSSLSNVFSNLSRQDQSFLFSIPSADWMNNNLFLNGNVMNDNSALIDPMTTIPPTSTNTTTLNETLLKQNFTQNGTTEVSTPISTSATSTITDHHNTNNNSQQEAYPSTSLSTPLLSRNIFHDFQANSPSTNIDSLLFSTSNHSQANHKQPLENQTIINKAAQVAVKAAAAAAAAASKAGTSTTKTISAPAEKHSMNTTTPLLNSISTTITAPSATVNSNTVVSTTENPHSFIRKPKLTITGKNVTADNIEEGYLQFVSEHEQLFLNTDMDNPAYAKRRFHAVPKTGDLSYTTWEVYQLVLQLHRKEIKNWSQLVGKLGLSDMTGRPQFAQRVKRWMHKYKIDYYFDYLLGNDYLVDSLDNKYSHCLLIGNYKKRKLNATSPSPSTTTHHNGSSSRFEGQTDEEDDEETGEEDQEYRMPILLAGSRKRMRDNSQNSMQIIENAQKFLRTMSNEDTEESEDDSKSNDNQTQPKQNEAGAVPIETENNNKLENDKQIEDASDTDNEDEEMNEEEDEEEEMEYEEDELASSASSPSSPIRVILPSPKLSTMKPQLPNSAIPTSSVSPLIPTPQPIALPLPSQSPILQHSPSTTTCPNCKNNESKIASMEQEMARLKAQLSQFENQCEKKDHQINKLLRLRDRTERWRKQIISDLARGPLIVSDDDDDDDDEEDDDEDEDET